MSVVLGCAAPSLRERYRGCLLGLATGDALGAALEFQTPGSFTPIDDMIGGGPFGLPPGYWTDDTAMALCLAQSLVERGGSDPEDQLRRYLRWYREGYLSSTGRCFDIGRTTREALVRFERTGQLWAGADPKAAGNGSLMRLAPVVLAYARTPRTAIEQAATSSRVTHGAPEAVDACRYFAALLLGALDGVAKHRLLDADFEPVAGLRRERPLVPRIAEVAAGSFKRRSPPQIRGSGYVVDCLEAALWAFYRGRSFREGLLLAVNLGDDADTTGAVHGQLAGAYYGQSSIPAAWRERLAHRELIIALADRLYELAGRRTGAKKG